jgi:2-hydroxychromene-2-carboxylate isomerase
MIDFYFDFSSPYGYLAASQIDKLAGRFGRTVNWHPILLGAIFKHTGGQPLTQFAWKGDYALHDFARSADFYGIPFKMPTNFPVNAVAPSRAILVAKRESTDAMKRLALSLFKALYTQDRDIGQIEITLQVADESGFDPRALGAAMQTQEVKDELKQIVDRAVERKVFGSPFFFIDNEPFWGVDRLPQIEWFLNQSE